MSSQVADKFKKEIDKWTLITRGRQKRKMFERTRSKHSWNLKCQAKRRECIWKELLSKQSHITSKKYYTTIYSIIKEPILVGPVYLSQYCIRGDQYLYSDIEIFYKIADTGITYHYIFYKVADTGIPASKY